MYRFFLYLVLILSTSCQYFHTERISSEDVLEEELNSMDWTDIDTYPAFPSCEGIMEKDDQRRCFENTILSSIRNQLTNGNWVTAIPLSDTVYLQLEVDTTGILEVNPIILDSVLSASLPKMDSLLMEGVRQLDSLAPAYKRGIPVRSKFTLPIVIDTKDL